MTWPHFLPPTNSTIVTFGIMAPFYQNSRVKCVVGNFCIVDVGSCRLYPSTDQYPTAFYKDSILFTVFYTLTLHSTHWHCILLYLPYFYCISLFQASVALMFTDLNLVLLLYYFIIALSRFLNLKWALCLIKSKLKVNGLRGLPRVTPKVASNSHHCFSVCFLIQASNWRLFDLPGVSGVI